MIVCSWCVIAQVVEIPAPVQILTIRPGTKLMLDLDTPLNTATARIEDIVWFTARNDIKVADKVAMPRGTPVRGSIVAVKPAVVNGKNQRSEIQIRLVEVPLAEGGSYAIAAEVLKVQGEKPAGGVNTQGKVNQAAQGAMLGGAITRSAKGAGIGAAAVVAVAVIGGMLQSRGPTSDIDLPNGSVFEAKLERALHIADVRMLAKTVPRSPAPKTPDAPEVAVVASIARGTAAPVDSPSNEVPALEPLPAGESAPHAAANATAEKVATAEETANA